MLQRGQRFGSYEILGPLGTGGMGEVYRARDSRLNREVALKVLREGFDKDAARLRRFEAEAKAVGSISHPNVLAIYDTGEHEGAPFLVTELLEGSTLRERLTAGPVPGRKALDIGAQIARGLAAAHDKGIVHRDVKPENVFLTRDGNVKLLDFGIARAESGEPTTGTLGLTASGAVMGTAGYMSPEQVRGQPADVRSDVFALGTVLYEVLTGRRAFDGDNAVSRGHAILSSDPAPMATMVSPAVEKIVRRCLEKSPDERFQSARDVAFAIEAVSENSSGPVGPIRARPRRGVAAVVGLGLLALGAAGAMVVNSRAAPESSVRFTQLTFRRGPVRSARFVHQGQTIVYSAGWEGTGEKLYSMNLKSLEPSPLGLDGLILSISSSDELLVMLGTVNAPGYTPETLARVGISGQAPREMVRSVGSADWAPDGSGPVVHRVVDRRDRLEFPIGNLLVESASGEIRSPRFSPSGDAIAFIHRTNRIDEHGEITIVDLKGRSRILAAGFEVVNGLGWSPSGDEVWFTATDSTGNALRAVTTAGKQRVVVRVPGVLELFDVHRDGRVLLGVINNTMSAVALRPGEHYERDLTWFGFSGLEDLTNDGDTVVFHESFVGRPSPAYLRKTDGSPAVRLGLGYPTAISPDGKWVLSITDEAAPRIVLLPTGPGEPIALATEGVFPLQGRWYPDGKRILVAGHEPGHADRLFVMPSAGGTPRAITPENVSARDYAVAADGTVAAKGESIVLYPENSEPKQLVEAKDEVPVVFSADGQWLYTYSQEHFPCRISRLNLQTGKKELWKVVAAQDTVGVSYCSKVRVTPDGTGYAYRFMRELTTLYLLEGLR